MTYSSIYIYPYKPYQTHSSHAKPYVNHAISNPFASAQSPCCPRRPIRSQGRSCSRAAPRPDEDRTRKRFKDLGLRGFCLWFGRELLFEFVFCQVFFSGSLFLFGRERAGWLVFCSSRVGGFSGLEARDALNLYSNRWLHSKRLPAGTRVRSNPQELTSEHHLGALKTLFAEASSWAEVLRIVLESTALSSFWYGRYPPLGISE